MNHLSKLALDQLASGIEPMPTQLVQHVEGCPDCSAKLERLRAETEAIRDTPEFGRGLARMEAAAASATAALPAKKMKRSTVFAWWLATPILAAACAALVIATLPPTELVPSGERLKGGAGIALVPVGQAHPTERLLPGQRVGVSLQAAGHAHALLFAVDEEGSLSTLDADMEFEVTPGSFVVLAFLSDEPIPVATAEKAVERALALCPKRPLELGCIAVEPLPGEQARARADYQVGGPDVSGAHQTRPAASAPRPVAHRGRDMGASDR